MRDQKPQLNQHRKVNLLYSIHLVSVRQVCTRGNRHNQGLCYSLLKPCITNINMYHSFKKKKKEEAGDKGCGEERLDVACKELGEDIY